MAWCRRVGSARLAEITEPLATLPLDALHRALGGRMVPFAGHAMPVQYTDGIIAEHNWTRTSASLFDVSHMGQLTAPPCRASPRSKR